MQYQTYSAQEKQEVVQRLGQAREGLLSTISGLSETQTKFKPAADVWSIAEIVEHLAIVESLVLMRFQEIMFLPEDPARYKDPDTALFGRVRDRSAKFKAPERGQPTGKPLTESLDRLLTAQEKIVGFIQSAPADFRQHTMPHPVFGPLDGHQWAVAVAGHCARHTEQIAETKAVPDFPKQ